MTTEVAETDLADVAAPARGRTQLVLLIIAVVAALAIAATVGWLVRGGGGSSTPGPTSVDAGFARDMSTHHQQAITMAGYVRDTTTDPAIKLIATDIELEQEFEVGRMGGWLDSWNLPITQPGVKAMSWMVGHDHLEADGLMPGMATQAQMNELESSTGTKMDILFLQLMIHHHQGGLPMAQYAAQHATEPYVRAAATAMVTNQTNEITNMDQLLTKLGGSELPPPAD